MVHASAVAAPIAASTSNEKPITFSKASARLTSFGILGRRVNVFGRCRRCIFRVRMMDGTRHSPERSGRHNWKSPPGWDRGRASARPRTQHRGYTCAETTPASDSRSRDAARGNATSIVRLPLLLTGRTRGDFAGMAIGAAKDHDEASRYRVRKRDLGCHAYTADFAVVFPLVVHCLFLRTSMRMAPDGSQAAAGGTSRNENFGASLTVDDVSEFHA